VNLVVSKATFQFFKLTIINLNVVESEQLIGDNHIVNVRGSWYLTSRLAIFQVISWRSVLLVEVTDRSTQTKRFSTFFAMYII